MKLNSLKINNFRNISNIEFLADEKINIICGQNAQGKTNLLESVWLMCGMRSFRGSKTADLIQFGKTFASLACNFETNREQSAKIDIEKTKTAFLNDVKKKSAIELSESFKCVVFSPYDMEIVKGSPSLRRNFLDSLLCRIKLSYTKLLSNYERSILQRNFLLKEAREKRKLPDTIFVFNERIANFGSKIIDQRKKLVNMLTSEAESTYEKISDGKEIFNLKYFSPESETLEDVFEIKEVILTNLQKNLAADIKTGATSFGPHRDDLILSVKEISAKNFGSQGQQRSVALSLKLAEAKVIEILSGETPIVLLDDVLSELDQKRQNFVLNSIDQRQVFLTCCEPIETKRLKGGKFFMVENGEIC